jgi:hypothetical protein
MSADVILSCRLANHDIVTAAGEIALSAPLHKGGTSKILELLAKEVRCCSLAALFLPSCLSYVCIYPTLLIR